MLFLVICSTPFCSSSASAPLCQFVLRDRISLLHDANISGAHLSIALRQYDDLAHGKAGNVGSSGAALSRAPSIG
jgi:hypothetical protein